MATFDEILIQVLALLQRDERVAYRVLKRRFALDDEYIEDLKADLIDAKRLAVDEDGKVLVWTGGTTVVSSQLSVASSSQPPAPQTSDSGLIDPRLTAGERRQLTVMFCDLVGSTALSEQLDPEELREVMQAYQHACVAVVTRFDGHVAKYLGDGLLVYFGYPTAHEDDAARAVRAGLGIVEAMQDLPRPNIRLPHPLQVRVGIHTGLVVAGEMGSGEYREQLAIVGETPNIAARLQERAVPDSVVISPTTYHLVTGLFACQDLGPQPLKGLSTLLTVYRVVRESEAQSRFEVAVSAGLTPLIGRDHEVGLLAERWEQAKQGAGQVVLLSGEAGIGKSRLVQTLKEQVIAEGATRIEFRCSPYHQNSAFYPVIEHLQRLLQFAPHDTPQAKLAKLQQALAQYRFPQADTLPLLASLLSLPQPNGAPPITLSPQKQKQKTQDVLVAWIVEEAERAAVSCAWEDLHWVDPSTLEVLALLLDQVPTTRLLALLTFRPDFTPPWRPHSHITQLTLNRLGRPQVEAMVEQVTGGKTLPGEVLQQIISKTDGVPLFVEELTKMVLESGLYVGAQHAAPLRPLGIPATLQDALMARLDRLAPVKEIAQVGATLGREFSYEVLHAVSPVAEAALQRGLRQLVEAELLYQRGMPPQATYIFKHALVQDTAYQSLLKSTRQQYHQQIAQVLEERFPQVVDTQPELVAHHYTQAGLVEQAIPYWHKAGQRAIQRSANIEAISHLTKGLEILKTLPDTPERTQQELDLQIALGPALIVTKGYGATEVEKAYVRARELCQQVGETLQLFRVLAGLEVFYLTRAELQTARELAEQLTTLAQRTQDPSFLLRAHLALGRVLFYLGELSFSREHFEQGITLYELQQQRSYSLGSSVVPCLSYTAWVLWFLGYPDQALKRSHEALALAQELSHPHSLALALTCASALHHLRREGQAAQELAEAAIALSTDQGFAQWLAYGTMLRGWALANQRQGEEGIAQIRQGLAFLRTTGVENWRPYYLALLAEAYGKEGQAGEGLALLVEALAGVHKTGERVHEPELYRLKGQLTLQSRQVEDKSRTSLGQVEGKSEVANPQPLTPNPQAEAEAEACFLKAIEIARRQQAKSLELRAVMSLSRLWQQQGKKEEAWQMLADIYGWFTEGFDTADLQEATALLDELS